MNVSQHFKKKQARQDLTSAGSPTRKLLPSALNPKFQARLNQRLLKLEY
jgi:hypothetical protein